jgi:hypothetical protein
VTEAFDIFADVDDLLEVLILSVSEDGVVDHYAIDLVIVVGFEDSLFKLLTIYLSEFKAESTANTMSLVLQQNDVKLTSLALSLQSILRRLELGDLYSTRIQPIEGLSVICSHPL